MKMKTLSVLAGVGLPLILTPPTDAGFVGTYVRRKPNPYGIFTVNVYAEFDNPGADRVQAVAGTPSAPLNITVVGGEFYNNPYGEDLAPRTVWIDLFPSLAYDSFYTIGIKARPTGMVDELELINLPPLAGNSVSTTQGAYGLVPPNAAQGNPFDPVNSFPGNGSVLIGQFSAEITGGNLLIGGGFLLQYVSDGSVGQSYRTFEAYIPTPGAWGLLAAAGFVGRRRRR